VSIITISRHTIPVTYSAPAVEEESNNGDYYHQINHPVASSTVAPSVTSTPDPFSIISSQDAPSTTSFSFTHSDAGSETMSPPHIFRLGSNDPHARTSHIAPLSLPRYSSPAPGPSRAASGSRKGNGKEGFSQSPLTASSSPIKAREMDETHLFTFSPQMHLPASPPPTPVAFPPHPIFAKYRNIRSEVATITHWPSSSVMPPSPLVQYYKAEKELLLAYLESTYTHDASRLINSTLVKTSSLRYTEKLAKLHALGLPLTEANFILCLVKADSA
jgi:hypothetical protein